jgi:hypothetical protein
MSKLQLAGSYVALITPFTDNDEVDYAKIEELVEWHIAEGYHAHLAPPLLPLLARDPPCQACRFRVALPLCLRILRCIAVRRTHPVF